MSVTELNRRAAHSPAWLWCMYDYVGAHTNELRGENERDRALLRLLMPLVGVSWIYALHTVTRSDVDPTEAVWMICSLIYAAAALGYWIYLKHQPLGGVHVQYAFMALDPMFVGWALYASPQLMAWFLVNMLVMIVRVGFRYGLNAMKVQLGFAWLGAAVPLFFGTFWHTQLQMSGSLVLMLLWAWWLCAPVIRSVERAKHLEIERRIEHTRVESLQESLQAKSEFLSRVSHELRSPLQGVVSALDVIESRFGQDAAEAEQLARIRRGATALNAQLRDLLTLARGDVGKMEVNATPFEVCALAATIAREVAVEAEAKGLTMVTEIPDEPIFVAADPARIDQVLTNLLTNAIRHTHAGSVRLTLHPYDVATGKLRFEVSDTGPGIPKDRIPTLFEPFTRYGEITRNDEGAGLGLAIVRTVLHFLGGTVEVSSEGGIGTTFSVAIPAKLIDGEQRDPTGRRSVLVVDDRQEVLEALSSVVEQLGFDCNAAIAVSDAANLLGARRYDVMFVDLDMPVKSGFELAAETRRSKGPNSQSLMISISAADVPDDRRGWPFDGHLTKPIDRAAIQRAIDLPVRATSAPK